VWTADSNVWSEQLYHCHLLVLSRPVECYPSIVIFREDVGPLLEQQPHHCCAPVEEEIFPFFNGLAIVAWHSTVLTVGIEMVVPVLTAAPLPRARYKQPSLAASARCYLSP